MSEYFELITKHLILLIPLMLSLSKYEVGKRIPMLLPFLISIIAGCLYAQLIRATKSTHSRAHVTLFSLMRLAGIIALFAFFSYLPLKHFIFMLLLFMLTMWFNIWYISRGTNNNGWL